MPRDFSRASKNLEFSLLRLINTVSYEDAKFVQLFWVFVNVTRDGVRMHLVPNTY